MTEKSRKSAKIMESQVAGDEISISRLLDSLLEYALEARASDIHIDPETEQIRVRCRIDGILYDTFVFPKSTVHSEIITRIKVLSSLRIDEHLAPQDGRFKANIKGEEVDVRVSIAPTYRGENAVLRLLPTGVQAFTLESMGFRKNDAEKIKRAIQSPYGMILSTGPTGSGKTSTLYTLIRLLNTKEVSIITIEDPIEYSIPGVNQIQANPRTGLTFANGLRSILRQDPNIIMVGEIRDQETASIAINAALTGHLLFSTLHTNDAATALPRLIDLQAEPFLIASTINVVIGQRLVRKICEDCRVRRTITEAEFESLKRALTPQMINGHHAFFTGKGCAKCALNGYRGRVGIYEVLEMTEGVRAAIMRQTTAHEVKLIAMKEGMTTMLEDGFQKALEGITTIEEVLRVIHE